MKNEYAYLEEPLSDKLGTKVRVTANKIEISFTDNDELNRILEIINK